jgi:hypothetical protein
MADLMLVDDDVLWQSLMLVDDDVLWQSRK